MDSPAGVSGRILDVVLLVVASEQEDRTYRVITLGRETTCLIAL